LVKPGEVIKREALGLAVMAAVALHPPLWRSMWRQELRGMQRPIGKKVAIAVAAAFAAHWMEQYRERNLDRWMAENPELFEGLPPPRGRGHP
jgi:hypothetical protein